MPTKAVLFDLGGTLIENVLNPFETFQKILENRGIRVTVEDVERAFTATGEELGDRFVQLAGKIPFIELYRTWNLYVLKVLGVEDENLAKKVNEQWLNVCGIAVYSDVPEILVYLRERGIKTGIISNAYEEEIYQICEMADMDTNLFDVIVGADTVENMKPGPEIFLHALHVLGVAPEEAIYVGNSLEKDYRGAEKAGLKPVLLLREGKGIAADCRCIGSLAGLKDYL